MVSRKDQIHALKCLTVLERWVERGYKYSREGSGDDEVNGRADEDKGPDDENAPVRKPVQISSQRWQAPVGLSKVPATTCYQCIGTLIIGVAEKFAKSVKVFPHF